MLNPEEMYITDEQYAQLMREQRKQKQIKQQLQNNQKSQRGFGYTYKEVKFDS